MGAWDDVFPRFGHLDHLVELIAHKIDGARVGSAGQVTVPNLLGDAFGHIPSIGAIAVGTSETFDVLAHFSGIVDGSHGYVYMSLFVLTKHTPHIVMDLQRAKNCGIFFRGLPFPLRGYPISKLFISIFSNIKKSIC